MSSCEQRVQISLCQQENSSARMAAAVFTVLKILAGMKPPPPIATMQSFCETAELAKHAAI
jgi:hypothetical protein